MKCCSVLAQEAEQFLNFVIIGAGPTGVEMAGAIAEIAHNLPKILSGLQEIKFPLFKPIRK